MRLKQVLPVVLVLWAAIWLAARWSHNAPGPRVQGGQAPAAVQVSTDRQTYAAGDTVAVTITNLGPATIMPHGGIVCDDLWPIRLERLGSGGWEAVPVPQDPVCAAASVATYVPGSSLNASFTAGPACGTYRVAFPFDIPGGQFGDLAPARSDPFTVQC